MHVATRSYLTAGIAVLGAGAIAVAPVQPVPTQVALDSHRVVSDLGIDLLASSIDPITPWVTTFETAAANIGTLVEFYLQKPFPLLQTIGANWATYIEEIGSGQGALIPEQIWGNIQTFFQAPWDPGNSIVLPAPPLPESVPLADGEYVSKTEIGNGFNPQDVLASTIAQLGLGYFFNCLEDGENCELPGQIAPIANFLNNHYSGQVLGLLGTVVSPFVQLVRSFTAVGEFFEAGDVIGAINELINIPAKMTNAFLNGGGYLDLTAIAEQFLPIEPGTIKSIGINLGGLLNAVPFDGSLINPENPPTRYSGGTGFDGVAADVLLKFQGLPIGWAGSVIGLGQFVAEQMLVTPPVSPTQAAAEPEAATPTGPADIEVPAEVVADAAPAVVEAPEPVTESAPAVVEDVVEEPAPVVVAEVEEAAPADIEAADIEVELAEIEVEIEAAEIEAAVAEVEAEVAEVEAPAAAEDNTPAAASGSDDSGDTGTRATDSRRGAASDD